MTTFSTILRNRLATMILLIGSSTIAHAQTVLDVGMMISSDSDGSAEARQAKYLADTAIGLDFSISQSIFVGGRFLLTYEMSTATDSVSTTRMKTAMGGAIGFGNSGLSGWRLALLAFYAPVDRFSGSFENTRYGGIGYGIEAAYAFKVGGIAIAPQVNFLQKTYTRMYANDASEALLEAQIEQSIKPYLTVMMPI
jgi:hypothetical protein